MGIAVVELRTGGVKTNIISNAQAKHPTLPEGSPYSPAKALTEKALRLEWADGIGIPADQWARQVVSDLSKASPTAVVFRGDSAWIGWLGRLFAFGLYDYLFKRMTGLAEIGNVLLQGSRKENIKTK